MTTFLSRHPDDTERLGRELGAGAAPGWVFGLTGDLGAGKTRFVQGLARGLGIPGRIPSPTFALVHEHRAGRIPLFHLDLYRLDTTDQIRAAGLEGYFDPREGVSVIEWFERWDGPPPLRLCRVRFHWEGESERRIDYDDPHEGAGWPAPDSAAAGPS